MTEAPTFSKKVAKKSGEETTQSAGINLSALVFRIVKVLQTYVVVPPGVSTLIAVWILSTYVFMRFRYTGYLHFLSGLTQSGKTTLLELLSMLCCGMPQIWTLPTPATIFRGEGRVLLLDELDKLSEKNKSAYQDIVAVLNAGYARNGTVERMEKDKKGNFVPRAFKVYSPKAFAGLSTLPETLADRSFTIIMQRSANRMPRFPRTLSDELGELRESLEAWAETEADNVEATYDALPTSLDDLAGYDNRFQDVSESLLVIASLADSNPMGKYRCLPWLLKGLKATARYREPSPVEHQLSEFLQLVEGDLKQTDEVFIPTSVLVSRFPLTEDLSSIHSGAALSDFLRPFDLRPEQDRKSHNTRGYYITRAWVKHLRQMLSKGNGGR